MRSSRRAAAGAAAALLTILLGACSNGPEPAADDRMETSAETPPESSAPEEPAVHNGADAEFAQLMIVHHQGALEMTGLAAGRASTPEVQVLAERIAAAQRPEIELMSGWLEAWGEETPEEAATGGMDHGDMEMEDGDQGTAMAELASLSGPDFDRRFLELMIAHHRGAIEMAEEQQRAGENPDAVDLARTIAADQAAEITEMSGLLDPGP